MASWKLLNPNYQRQHIFLDHRGWINWQGKWGMNVRIMLLKIWKVSAGSHILSSVNVSTCTVAKADPGPSPVSKFLDPPLQLYTYMYKLNMYRINARKGWGWAKSLILWQISGRYHKKATDATGVDKPDLTVILRKTSTEKMRLF